MSLVAGSVVASSLSLYFFLGLCESNQCIPIWEAARSLALTALQALQKRKGEERRGEERKGARRDRLVDGRGRLGTRLFSWVPCLWSAVAALVGRYRILDVGGCAVHSSWETEREAFLSLGPSAPTQHLRAINS